MQSYDLLNELKKAFPNFRFVFCMGLDVVSSIPSWKNFRDLIDENDFIVINRQDYQFPSNAENEERLEKLKEKIIFLDKYFGGSSTMVRNRISEKIENSNKLHLGINALTTTSVIKFIVDHGLYQNSKE